MTTEECRHQRLELRNNVPTCIMCGEPRVSGRCRACGAALDDHDGLVKDEARCPRR